METLFVGHEIQSFAELSSTNEYLKDLCIKRPQNEGLTVTTEYQTLGRGQIGNSWESESGLNLLVSVLLRPNFLSPDRQFHLNMSVCLAICDSLNDISPGFQIKWPNDILYDGKKVAGILIENSMTNTKLESSIIGFGINVNQIKFPKKLSATSLQKILGNPIDRSFLLRNILKKMEVRYLKLKVGTGKLYSDYYNSMFGYLQTVSILYKEERRQIQILGVEPSGKLITTLDGKKKKFDFKEMSFMLD